MRPPTNHIAGPLTKMITQRDLCVPDGEKMRELRQKKRWTLYDLADRVGVSHQTVSMIERGKTGTSHETMAKMTEVLLADESH